MAGAEIKNRPDDVCEACGAAVPEGTIGCQKLFEAVTARAFSDYRYGSIHRLTVDAYSLQHPERYMRSGKSFAAHLTGMCAALEFEDSAAINRAVQKWLSRNPAIDKPAQLPDHRGEVTIIHVHGATSAEAHHKRVWEWAHSVWNAWSEYHTLARQLIGEATGRSKER